MPPIVTIRSLPAAFNVNKEMQADGCEWGEDYRGAGREILAEIIQGHMHEAIDRQLEARARCDDLSGAMHLAGHEHEQRVYSAIAAMDILLLTSRVEGLPNVPVEAQALGVPVVTTRAGGSVAWLHAAGPQLRPALQALQSRDLLAQCGVLPRERGDLLEQLDDQLLQLVEAKIIDI